jgi:hypothetical protein
MLHKIDPISNLGASNSRLSWLRAPATSFIYCRPASATDAGFLLSEQSCRIAAISPWRSMQTLHFAPIHLRNVRVQ